MIHSIQIRQARATLKISRIELCVEANISLKTIQRLEEDEEEIQKANLSTIKKIKDYFSSRGIKFLFPKEDSDDEYEGIGLRYYKSKDQKVIS